MNHSGLGRVPHFLAAQTYLSMPLPDLHLQRYQTLFQRLEHLLENENDWVAIMATTCCELHHTFEHFHWTGFYRAVSDDLLVIGPYQGGHGCLRIPFDCGICGLAARTRTTQLVPDVHVASDHIACSASTRSEIVVPVRTPSGRLLAVLDVDSDIPDAFNRTDQENLETLCRWLGALFDQHQYAPK